MNTPYSSSGASSRAHYALVRRVEEARSQKDAETYLRDEVQLMRRRFALSPMSTSDIRVSLIVLIYCLTTSHGSVTRTSLEFAIPSAIHLVEAGSTSAEKRVGYLFCNEAVPKDHGMRLMLINSIRKDLESRRVARMSLALSCIIAVPFAEVVPAVIDLILKATSNSSPRIKALAIKTLTALASVDPDILTQERVAKAIEPRLHDGEEMVAKAALEACIGLSNTFPALNRPTVDHCIGVLRQFSRGKAYSNYSSGYIQKICQTLSVSLDEQSKSSTEVLEMALRTLKTAIKRNNYALGLESIRLISKVPTDISVAYFAPHDEVPTSKKLPHPIDSIKHLLGSQSLNDHYVFLSYLSILPVRLWAGPPEADGGSGVQQTDPTHLPLALSQWEVERIITFMDSSDEQIRRLTLTILTHGSSTLVEKSYEGRLSQLSSSSSSPRAIGAVYGRLLEMADALCCAVEDEAARGRWSATKYSEVCELCKGETVSHEILEHAVRTLRKGKQPISQPFVSNWTLAIMQGKTEGDPLVSPSNLLEDQSSSVDSAPFFIDPNTPASSKFQARALNWTLMLVFVTFVCEHAILLHRDDLKDVVTWLASCLEFYPPTMQEPMILCVIRLIALLDDSTEIGESTTEAIKTCGTNSSSRLFKKYCDTFLSYSNDLDRLKALIDSDATLSIPEVVTKLETSPSNTIAQTTKAAHIPTPSKPPASSTTPLTPSALAQSQLRYAAYDHPKGNANPRVNSFSTLSTSSRRSEASSRHARAGDEHVDLTKTITAGDLALAEASDDDLLTSMSRIAAKPKLAKGKRGGNDPEKEELVKKVDLISLDSPFLSEPIQRAVSSSSRGEGSGATSYASLPETNFDVIWAECEASGNSTRGWLDAPLDNAVLRLQGVGIHIDVISIDDAPFQGELKVLLKADPPESEDSDSIAKVAAVRLRDGEEGSCLWQMRSSDHALLVLVKQALCE
ncbi:hypothetical protein SCHPADRAFT_427526 [Schizopora paradoxa]|uniref:Clathrin/coatomer adaptor adaptin-like N-terminal domain-containing protein n=1 Tax=Schizopora paradoxa TaxID=27342 RepID=A0A0H2RK33_9AGAM|nr:hypothetical protein SCHPADRAFT_427526 [Schizopora paradoxa]